MSRSILPILDRNEQDECLVSDPANTEGEPLNVEPHPFSNCAVCDEIARESRGEEPEWMHSWNSDGLDRSNASRVFKVSCDSCSRKLALEPSLCHSCQHIRLRHLSFCAAADELPERLCIRQPDNDTACPLCQVFIQLAYRIASLGFRKRNAKLSSRDAIRKMLEDGHGFPLHMFTTEWRAEQVQWRVKGPDIAFGPATFLIVQDNSEELPLLQQIPSDLDRIRLCVSQCVKDHGHCRGPSNVTLPADFRLIDVEQQRIVALDSTISICYVALSYTWGDSQDVSDWSTKANISMRLNHLDISSLPATIKDTILVCEKMHERYLWIDRLCIIQDDEVDKNSQVHAMTAIYSAAKFVIVNASGNSIHSGIAGISRPRDPQFTTSAAGLHMNIQAPPLWDVVGPSNWNSRGWTYQEAILPRRKVFFTRSQIFYECGIQIDHEETLSYSSFDQAMHSKVRYPTTTTSLSYDAPSQARRDIEKTELRIEKRREKRWEAYARHLPRYRERKLGHLSDLVAAFTGIIKALYPGDNAYFGLPLLDIDLALLWWGKRPWPKSKKHISPHEDATGFPSWSWASRLGAAPTYFSTVHRYFAGSLCLWFQPTSDGSQIVPIMAPSDTPAGWWNEDDDNGASQSRSLRIYGILGGPGAGAARKILLKVICNAMVNSAVDIGELLESGQSMSDLDQKLYARWPLYSDFWHDIYGRGSSIRDLQIQLFEETHGRLKDGALVTRAQITSIMIKQAQSKDNENVPSWEPAYLMVHNMQDEIIGHVVPDHGSGIEEALREGVEKFECIALSVSAKKDKDSKEFQGELSFLRDLTAAKSATAADVGMKREDSTRWTSAYDDCLSELEIWVNALIVHRRHGLFRRAGLVKIDLDCWLSLSRVYESIVLV